MASEGLRDLYIDELKDLYNAENQLVKALPKMAKAASSEELKQGFEQHLEQTRGHVQRLEQIFKSLDESPKGKKCAGMEGLVKEGSEVMEEDFEGALMDAALIGAAQRVEHYEIAAYGTASEFAKLPGRVRTRLAAGRDLAGRKGNRRKADRVGQRDQPPGQRRSPRI